MRLKKYNLYSNCVELFWADGSMLRLWLNKWSGKVIFRYKVNTISNVKHPGIIIGYDQYGNWHCMHNHYETGRPTIELIQNMAKGQQLFTAERQSQFGQHEIIKRALNEVLKERRYDWWDYNCQTCVNRVCFNVEKSEAVENWAARILAGLIVIAGVGAINNAK